MSDGSPVHPLELPEINRKKISRGKTLGAGMMPAFILHFSLSATKNI